MALIEYDCSDSQAIERIIYNNAKNELIVKFKRNPKIYLYDSVPSTIQSLLNSNASKGLIVSNIKKLTNYRVISSYPTGPIITYQANTNNASNNKATNDATRKAANNTNSNTNNTNNTSKKASRKKSKRKKNHKNFSSEWLRLLSTQPHRDHLEKLLPILSSCHPKYPPDKRPIPADDDDDNMSMLSSSSLSQFSKSTESSNSLALSNSIKTQASHSSLSNPFSSLRDDSDDDDNDSSDDDDNNDDFTFNSDIIDNDNYISTQSRYLIVKIKSYICDTIRQEAIELEKSYEASVYIKIAALWQLAYLKLNELIISTDAWWAILIDTNVNYRSGKLNDDHVKYSLSELHEGLQILKDDTDTEKDRTMNRLTIIFQRITEKLNPMLSERNQVKKKFGVW